LYYEAKLLQADFKIKVMKKILIVLSIIFIGCEKEEIRPFPCLDGNCGYAFAVDTISSPGAKLSPDGYWRVKHNGINYFTIRGLISQLHPAYVVNKDPTLTIPSGAFIVVNRVNGTYRPVWVSCSGVAS
jgi:hypothetical protein